MLCVRRWSDVESPKQGSKRFNFITKTICFAHLGLLFIYAFYSVRSIPYNSATRLHAKAGRSRLRIPHFLTMFLLRRRGLGFVSGLSSFVSKKRTESALWNTLQSKNYFQKIFKEFNVRSFKKILSFKHFLSTPVDKTFKILLSSFDPLFCSELPGEFFAHFWQILRGKEN